MNIRLLLFATLFALLPGLTSCSSMGSSSTKSMLSASGFVTKTPENPEQQKIYDALPAYKIQRGVYEGKVFYAYKDEKAGIAYVGGEKNYQKYEALATQRSIATANMAAAQMNRDMAYSMYGAWGGPWMW